MSVTSRPRYTADELLDLWQPSPMPEYLAPFAIVASQSCLQPVTLLPIEARRQYTRSFKARPKKGGLRCGRREGAGNMRAR